MTRFLVAAVLAALSAGSLWAQKFEISPFAGYRFGGNIPVRAEVEDVNVNKIKFDSGGAFGVSAGVNLSEHLGVEFMWSRQKTNARAEVAGGGTLDEKLDTNLDQYLGNILIHFKEEDDKLRPFILFGLGATRGAAAGSSETKFAFTAGGGVKYWFSNNIGLRAQARWAPTYLFSTPGGTWCNWWGYCWVVPNDHFLHQAEVTVGAAFRF